MAFESNQMHLNQMQVQMQMSTIQMQVQMQMCPPRGIQMQVQMQMPHLHLQVQMHLHLNTSLYYIVSYDTAWVVCVRAPFRQRNDPVCVNNKHHVDGNRAMTS